MRTFHSRILLPEPGLHSSVFSYQFSRHPNYTHPPSSPYLSHYLHLCQPTSKTLKTSSSRCHIFWDLDNVQPTHVEDIPVIGHAISAALIDLITQVSSSSSSPSSSPEKPPPPPLQLTVFANPTTLQKFSAIAAEISHMSSSSETTTPTTTMTSAAPSVVSCLSPQQAAVCSSSSSSSFDLHQAVVGILGGTLILTTGRKQSVDFAMKSAMLEYFQEERKKIASEIESDVFESELVSEREIVIACVSDDTDYVQVLNYLGNNNNSSSGMYSSSSPAIVRSHEGGGGESITNSSSTIDTATSESTSSSSTNSSSTKHKDFTITIPPVLLKCRTVSIGEHKRRKRPAWAAPRKLDSLALPAACDAAITLFRPRKDTANGINIDRESSSSAAAEWRVETVWVNPKGNWKGRIKQ